jgi:2-keto-4-pentenoate hydratase
LQAGDLILAGSLTHVRLPAGGAITAEIDGVGQVQATVIAPAP